MNKRIIICGGNGSGKSTLGKALADAMGIKFMDNEDYYFPKSGSGYKYDHALTREEFIPTLHNDMVQAEDWIFASVKGNYGEQIESMFTHAILIDVPKEIRMQRVWDRSYNKFGDKILFGGELYEQEKKFFDMVRGRTNEDVENWVSHLKCPVIRVDGTKPVKENVELLMAAVLPGVHG